MSQRSLLRSRSLSSQIAIGALCLSALIFAALILFVSISSNRTATRQAQEMLQVQAQGIVNLLESDLENTKLRANASLTAFKIMLPGSVRISSETQSLGQYKDLRIAKAGDQVISGNTALLERAKSQLGGAEPAILVRNGDEFVRAATLLKDKEGNSMAGKAINNGPDTTALLAGSPYTGVVKRVGKYFVSVMEPIKDNEGRVVGALSVRIGIDTEVERLRRLLADMKVGKTGYPVVTSLEPELDDVQFIVHPSLAGKTMKEIDNPTVRRIISEQVQKRQGVITYEWPNKANGDKPETKVSVYMPAPGWNWMVLTGSFEEEFTDEARSLRNWLVGIAALLGCVMIASLTLLIRNRMAPMQAVTDALHRLGQGDFSHPILCTQEPTDNEIELISRSVNQTQGEIAQLIRAISQSSTQVETSARALSQASHQVTQASDTQSNSASELASAVEELTHSIGQIAENARDASQQAQVSCSGADQGRNHVDQVVDEMHRIAAEIQDSADTVNRLGERTTAISAVIEVIKEVAEQTNMLALNAAIEAARAGESGRGFAVVADEVRKLAERTSSSTQQISETILLVQSEANASVERIDRLRKEVQESVTLASQAGTTLSELAKQNTHTGSLVGDIAASTDAQSRTSQQVAQGVETIARMAEQNRTITHRNQDEADQLSRLAEQLRNAVARFRV